MPMSAMARRLIRGAVIATVLLGCMARAEGPPRIGILAPSGGGSAPTSLRESLRELGYVEGKNLIVESRQYEQSGDAMHAAAVALVQSRVDLIVVVGTQAARAVLRATSTIPVVFLSADPISGGLAASLAHPGANATGISAQSIELIAKRLQMLRQVAPRTRHFVMLANPQSPMYAAILRETRNASSTLRIDVSML